MGEGGEDVSETQVDPSSLTSVTLGWQSACTGVDNLVIDGGRQARIECSVQEHHGLCSNSVDFSNFCFRSLALQK